MQCAGAWFIFYKTDFYNISSPQDFMLHFSFSFANHQNSYECDKQNPGLQALSAIQFVSHIEATSMG